jgi:phenylpropionate dioxygenase-like ring-hydroxylating dioxygenase large terminal subunit
MSYLKAISSVFGIHKEAAMVLKDLETDWISELAGRQQPGWSLERPFYTDESIFQKDIEKIWLRYWIYVGHLSQLPQAGSYFTLSLGDEPILLVHGADGQVRAFLNVCRHRGSLVCNEVAGRMKKLVCPYHQWVYDLDGALRTAKHMPESFDKTSFGLHPIHCRQLEGFLFVSFAENPPDFDLLLPAYLPHMRMYQLANAKVAYSASYPVRANWKLIAENFRECYHCGVGHPEYCSVIIGADLDQGRERARLVRAEKRLQWEAQGIPTYGVLFERSEAWYYCERYPYQPGFSTMSADGKPVAPPLGHLTDPDVGVWSIVQYPNFWLDVNHDYAWAMQLRPVSAKLTEVQAQWLVRADAVEGRDYDLDKLVWFWKTTGEQDWQLCEDNQAGVNSRYYRPGPYSDYAEGGPGQFVDWYLSQMRGN